MVRDRDRREAPVTRVLWPGAQSWRDLPSEPSGLTLFWYLLFTDTKASLPDIVVRMGAHSIAWLSLEEVL